MGKTRVPAEEVVLSDDQEQALAAMLAPVWPWGALFVTGAAGTGKSTVLREFRRRVGGNVVVVAPTGIAAIQCGGQTIHRTFRLPPRFIRYRDVGDVKPLTGAARALMLRMDTLLIDEISMVRADVMDAIDWCLRLTLDAPNLPFGGKRVIAVGDVMQLPPVVRPEDAPMLAEHWTGPFFFDANVWREAPLGVTELRTIHRQASDPEFAAALRALRDGDPEAIEFLNSRCGPRPAGVRSVQLTPRRDEADRINALELAVLPEVARVYCGAVDGEYPEGDMPTERNLSLKVGAQVMIVANGDGFVNGTLGVVTKLEDASVTVGTPAGEEFELGRSAWERVEFQLDGVTRRIEPRVVATFRQIPVRLAWATTIHKAQGLTLDAAHVEVGRGFFSHGQAYVALSRVRGVGRLTLSRAITNESLRRDLRVFEFRRATEEEGVWRGAERRDLDD